MGAITQSKHAPEKDPYQAQNNQISERRKTAGLQRSKTAPKRGSMIRVGYARVSTDEQTTALQLHALDAAGCSTVFQEQAGGTKTRPELTRALDSLTEGAALVVWRFDRLGRSLFDLLQIVQQIEAKGAHLVSITEQIDTGSSAGRMVFHVMGALAQFERDLIRERTKAGLDAAKAAGQRLGRPRALRPAQIRQAMKLIEQGERPPEVARSFGVGPSTLRAAIARARLIASLGD
jgi:DNA invertase Pin-like site-specific DNA recombinase